MTLHRFLSAGLLAGLLSLLGSPASAQGLSVHLGKRIGDAQVDLSFHTGHHGHPSYGIGLSTAYPRASCRPSPAWNAGHYETVEQRVWIPTTWERIWVEPVYRFVQDAWGRTTRLLVREGHWESVQRPGHYEIRHVQVWRPGGWSGRYVSQRFATYGSR